METKRFIYYQEDDKWVRWLEEYPGYRTQGYSLEELQDNLREIYYDLSGGKIQFVRRIGELKVG